MKAVAHLSKNSFQSLRLIWFNRVDFFLKFVQPLAHLLVGLCVSATTATPLAVVVKRVKGEEVGVLALFAVNTGHICSKLSWVLTPVANAVKTPGVFDITPPVHGAKEVVVVVVVRGDNLRWGAFDGNGRLADVREVVPRDDFHVGNNACEIRLVHG